MSIYSTVSTPIIYTNQIDGFTTIVTSVGTLTLVTASNQSYYFTGSTTHTVVLPVATTLAAGQKYYFHNVSTGAVTVQTSGGNVLAVITSGHILTATCVNPAGGTGTASWSTVLVSATGSPVLDNAALPTYPTAPQTEGIWYGPGSKAKSGGVSTNIFVGGGWIGSPVATGGSNTVLGFQAGNTLTTGNNNLLLGNGATPSSATVSNEITLGNSSITLMRAVGSTQFGPNVVATAGQNSHARGQADTPGRITASGVGSFATGRSLATSFITSSGLGSYAGGYSQSTSTIQSTGGGAYAYGATLNVGSLNATALGSSVMGYSESTSGTGITSSGLGSRSQGYTSSYGTITSSGLGSHAEGYSLLTQGAVGNGLIASGDGSHVEGYAIGTNGTIQATGIGSHAEGYASSGSISIASGAGSHVEGQNVKASGLASHAEGYADPAALLRATGTGSHAQGSSKISGQIFITGQDPDFHCQGDSPPTVVFLQTGLNYSMGGTLGLHTNKILWVESWQQPLPLGHLYGYNCFPFLSTSLGVTLVMGSAPVTNVVGNGVTVTYTCANNFTAGQIVSIYGVFPATYNLTNVAIATRTATQFTVTNPAVGAYQQGGYVRNPAAGDYDIVDNLGFREVILSDYRTIAVASTFGGMLRTAELNSLGARFSDITTFIAAGGGIFASSENDDPMGSTTLPHTATITNAVGDSVTVTYTAANTFVAGEIVNITGVNPGVYNLTGVTIASRTPTQFTVTNTAVGAYVSGGVASAPHIPYFSWFPGGGSITITLPTPPYVPTAFGISLGLNAVNLNAASHNSFLTYPASLAIVSIDALTNAMALATTGISNIQATNDGSFASGSIFGVGEITASGLGSTAQGRCVSSGSIIASGDGAHAEGYAAFAQQNTASGLGSHVEGQNCTSSGIASHSEGCNNVASGNYSHAAGYSATATGLGSHAEGYATGTGTIIASGQGSHCEGFATTGENNLASGQGSHSEGHQTTAAGTWSHAEGWGCSTSGGNGNHAEGVFTNATSSYIGAHSEGYVTNATNWGSHSEGYQTNATGRFAHSEGESTTASGNDSHAEGLSCTASGVYSHAEGQANTASGPGAHCEGQANTASGISTHVEGFGNNCAGDYCLVGGRAVTVAAGHNASFIFNAADAGTFATTGNNQFAVRALGAIRFQLSSLTELTAVSYAGRTNWSYTAAAPANWTGAAPTSVAEAIDRLAAALAPLVGGSIP